jgi:hypothetical protein
VTGQWFSLGSLVSSTSKTDRNDITEILLKVALSTKNLNLTSNLSTQKRPEHIALEIQSWFGTDTKL